MSPSGADGPRGASSPSISSSCALPLLSTATPFFGVDDGTATAAGTGAALDGSFPDVELGPEVGGTRVAPLTSPTTAF